MKWYLGSVNIKTASINKIKYLYEKNFLTGSPEKSFEYIDNNISYAEIYKQRYVKNCRCEIEENILIFGDIEIYNKDELINKYQLNNIDDTYRFLVDLYKLKGIAFLDEICGEYSIIIYDKTKNEIFLISDHINLKPLFWVIDGSNLYFASDMFLLEEYISLSNINIEYFEEYYQTDGLYISEKTPYKGLNRVRGGYYVKVVLDSMKIINKEYWTLLNKNKNICYKQEFEYYNKFLELLKDSVKNRLLSNGSDGILMSGGLDSTSLFAVSKMVTKEISTVSGVFDNLKDCDERYHIEKVLNMYNQDGIYVNCDNFGTLSGYPEKYFFTFEPFVNSLTLNFTSSLIKEAANRGIKNIIDGYAADYLLTGSLVAVIDKMKSLNFIDGIKDIKEISIMQNETFISCFKKFFLEPLIIKNRIPDISEGLTELLSNKVGKLKNYNQKEMYLQLNCMKSMQYLNREICPRYNISSKHPFLDKKIIEFIYSIPADLRLNSDSNKYILRKTMNKFLPNDVAWRIIKTQHVSLTYKGINDSWQKLYNKLCNFNIQELGVVNIDKNQWIDMLNMFRNGQNVKDNFFVLILLEIWFNDYLKKIKN